MRTTIFTLILITGLIGFGSVRAADARVHVDVHIGIPPPPSVVFESGPHVVLVPHTRVYYVPDYQYDLYRYRDAWYLNRDGYWYRGSTSRGPFTAVIYDRVPRSIIGLPGRYHHHRLRPVRSYRHHGPEHHGHAEHRGRSEHHEHGHSEHHGHGRHHGH